MSAPVTNRARKTESCSSQAFNALLQHYLPIVLQKSKIAGLQIYRKNTKQEAIADSYNLSRAIEVACKFSVGR